MKNSCCGLLALVGCAATEDTPLAPVWMTTSAIEDGCAMGTGLVDGPYQSALRLDGGTQFTWDVTAATWAGDPTASALGPFYCEASGESLSCWPVSITRGADASHPEGYPGITTAWIAGAWTENDFDGTVTFRGLCPDAAGCGDAELSPALPCESVFGLVGSRPLPQEPGACPAEDDSTLGEAAHVDIYNYTGEEVGVSWTTADGVIHTTLDSGVGPSSWDTAQGVWWKFTTAYDTEGCRGAIQVDEAIETIEIRSL